MKETEFLVQATVYSIVETFILFPLRPQRSLHKLFIMEWNALQKSSVKSLLSCTVSQDYRKHAWQWLLKSILIVERNAKRRDISTWHIAQALLLTQTAQWPTDTWRAHIQSIRTWQHQHPDSLTMLDNPSYVYCICCSIKDSGRRFS